jgi:hypothetical protein
MIVNVGERQMLVVIMVDCESRWWWIKCFSLGQKDNNEQINLKN